MPKMPNIVNQNINQNININIDQQNKLMKMMKKIQTIQTIKNIQINKIFKKIKPSKINLNLSLNLSLCVASLFINSAIAEPYAYSAPPAPMVRTTSTSTTSLSYGREAPLARPMLPQATNRNLTPIVSARAAAPPPQAPSMAGAPPNNFGKQVGFTPSLPRVGEPRMVGTQVNQTVNYMRSMQLTPKTVRQVKQMNLATLEANSSPYVEQPKATTRTVLLDLSPGVAPPHIRLSAGNLTSVVFSDMYGDAWMIERVSMNRQLFNDGGANNGESATNVITVEPTQAISNGNMSVILRGMATPIMFTLSSGKSPSVDFRVDVKVTGYNPDAKPRALNNNMPDLDDMIPYFLDGVPPREAKKINTNNTQVEAWNLNGRLYVRTIGEMQYPAYQSSARSTAGVAVYRFAEMYGVLTVIQNGRVFNVNLEH